MVEKLDTAKNGKSMGRQSAKPKHLEGKKKRFPWVLGLNLLIFFAFEMLSLTLHDRLLRGSCLTLTLTQAQPNLRELYSITTVCGSSGPNPSCLGTVLGPSAHPSWGPYGPQDANSTTGCGLVMNMYSYQCSISTVVDGGLMLEHFCFGRWGLS